MKLPFYFDYSCPWAYLGSCRAESYFGGLGAEIEFHPIHLADVRESPREGSGRPHTGARRLRYVADDLRHWAEVCGAEFSPQAREARASTRLLLQAALVAHEEGRFREFHYPAYRARWAEARDVSDPATVRSLLEGAGLDADRALERAQSPELRERLDACSRDAMARGVFGVPTVFVGDEMFWGNDRFEAARHYLVKHFV